MLAQAQLGPPLELTAVLQEKDSARHEEALRVWTQQLTQDAGGATSMWLLLVTKLCSP